jgi:hypothetical protein
VSCHSRRPEGRTCTRVGVRPSGRRWSTGPTSWAARAAPPRALWHNAARGPRGGDWRAGVGPCRRGGC